ncbi:hypothetical protein QAD02_002492 [Eretmocerus hayati]|uniref:Uncharacterized protein n=1 Tax=Eretmocerus hayati TaxID=131215 RepID=A0ACC2NK00_9HYME|nr:hypothetical protein QAD02_002492 [Eretmocerus hayati]
MQFCAPFPSVAEVVVVNEILESDNLTTSPSGIPDDSIDRSRTELTNNGSAASQTSQVTAPNGTIIFRKNSNCCTFLKGEYENNELFILLYSTKEGKAILRRYKKDGYFDEKGLKKIIIEHYLDPDLYFKITRDVFLRIKSQLLVLFPCQKQRVVFEVAYTNSEGQHVGPRGYIYFFYVRRRRYYYLCGFDIGDESELEEETPTVVDTHTQSSETDESQALVRITSPYDAEKYTENEVILDWALAYFKRMGLLTPHKKKKPVTLQKYFNTFPCFIESLVLILLKNDYKTNIDSLIVAQKIDKSLNYNNLLSTSWPELSTRIVKHCGTSKCVEIRQFLLKNKNLLNRGYDGILALFLISFSPKVLKKLKKIGNEKPECLKKQKISDCFILHVEDSRKKQTSRESHEQWLKSYNQQVHPYLICCGQLPNVEFFLIVNGFQYSFNDPIEAVETCYKCLVATKNFPAVTEFAWSTIDLLVYGLEPYKSNANVKDFVQMIRKNPGDSTIQSDSRSSDETTPMDQS